MLLFYFFDIIVLKWKVVCKIKRIFGNILKDRIEFLRINYVRME